jgi:SAM-dependent methyltransferase
MLPDAFYGLEKFLDEYKHLLPIEKIKERMKGTAVRMFIRIQGSTKKSFGYEWLRYDVQLEREDREVFLRDSQISEESLRGKLILDAGCGMGRYTRIAGKIGGEIVGVDLSQSVFKAYQMTQDNPCAHIIQGDILRLPFKKKQFDIIYSMGVLHHTPDAKKSFLNLLKYLKERGLISIWLYGTAGNFNDFKTNPLRKDRQSYTQRTMAKRIHWLIVYIREIVFKAVRLVTARIPVPLLYFLCYSLAAMGKVPLLKYLTASVHENWRVRLQENFDWFSPQYQSHHTKEEVLGWFKEAELDDISILRHGFIPRVGVKAELSKKERALTPR